MSFGLGHKFTFSLAMRVLVAALLLLPVSLRASDTAVSPAGPGAVIGAATERIMALVEEAPEYFDEDPERYFSAIGGELDKVVDFRGFARGVMGTYASSSRYKSLDASGRETLKNQLDRFTTVLRESLIRTYSRGLLAFGGSEVELADTEFSEQNDRVASVLQRVHSDEGNVYLIRYQMGQYRDGQWRLRNMVIEDISLGEIYRNQFEAAVEEMGGDVDRVITSWNDTSVAVDSEGEDCAGE